MSRLAFGLVLAGSCAFLAVDTSATAQTKIPVPPVPRPGSVDPRMPLFMTCSKHCDDCARLCDMTAAHCLVLLTTEGNKDSVPVLRHCQDCAAICTAASRVSAKDGPLSALVCTACADACKKCGDACEKMQTDPIIKRCLDECRNCEKSCREMSKVGQVENKDSKDTKDSK